MAGTDRRKQSLYFSDSMLEEIPKRGRTHGPLAVLGRPEGVEDGARSDHGDAVGE